MAGINYFYQFATLASTDDILSDGQYESDPERLSGNVPGIARQQLVNKSLKQSSALAYAIGESAATLSGLEISDDGDGLANFVAFLNKAFIPIYGAANASQYLRVNSQGTGITFVNLPAATSSVAGIVQLATSVEANAGTNTVKAVTPAGIQGFFNGHQDITGNAGTANKWKNAISLSFAGDVSATALSIDGSANQTATITVNTSTKLRTPRTFSFSGITATSKTFDGTADVAFAVSAVPSSILSGMIPISLIPPAAISKLVVVADQAARFALTTNEVQDGDTVKQVAPNPGATVGNLLYYVVDDSKLNSDAGYEVYQAGSAAEVPWSGVQNKPTTLAGYGVTAVPWSTLTNIPIASTSVTGIVPLASTAETVAGTLATKAVTPSGLISSNLFMRNNSNIVSTSKNVLFAVNAPTITSGAVTIDTTTGNVVLLNLSSNLTLTITNEASFPTNSMRLLTLLVIQTGSYTITWPANVHWMNVVPTFEDQQTLVNLWSTDGTNWYNSSEAAGGGSGGGSVITVSESAPTGGDAGDLWVQIPA